MGFLNLKPMTTSVPGLAVIDGGVDGMEVSMKKPGSGYHSDVTHDASFFKRRHISLQHVSKSAHAHADFNAKYIVEKGQALGEGSYGKVVTVTTRLTGEKFAMKTINARLMGIRLEDVTGELTVQKGLDHPNICKIVESFVDTATTEVFIIMERCTGGMLVDLVEREGGKINEEFVATLTDKMLSAMLYCHSHGVIHRDVCSPPSAALP